MARHTGLACRKCRRENIKLFLKGDRCYSEKCSVERRAYAPGQHGKVRFKKQSDYALQLREKQKVKKIYGMLEAQFRMYFYKAEKMRGVTGDILLQLLESRLDNVVYRLGMCCSRNHARQLILHNHVRINGNKVTIASYQVKVGDQISIKDKSKENQLIKESLESVVRRGIPSWLELDKNKCSGLVRSIPVHSDISHAIDEQLIVELYSK